VRVLVACEFSGIVRDAFIARGHDAISCDLLPTERPGPHYQGDVMDIINDGWDLMIAHPPCTYFSTAGANWLFRGGQINQDRYNMGLAAKEFFMRLYNANIPLIAIENPVQLKIFNMPQHTQEIQPYQFGDPYKKKTRLWLRGLPLLVPTNIVEPIAKWVGCGNGSNKDLQNNAVCKNGYDRNKRAKTFQGIADAMAEQRGGLED
jgi:hypothetical protein